MSGNSSGATSRIAPTEGSCTRISPARAANGARELEPATVRRPDRDARLMATALFVCKANAGRSQMSAALFERAAGGRHRALSAGSEADPQGRVHPPVVDVMRELGIDLSGRRPQRLTT